HDVLHSFPELGWLNLQVRAENKELAVEVVPEDLHRLQQHVRAFVWVELPEEREPVTHPVRLLRLELLGFSARRLTAVGLDDDFRPRDPPFAVALGRVFARHDEEIGQVEMRLDETFSREEQLWRNLWKAFVATARRLVLAELVALRPDHLAVAVADR